MGRLVDNISQKHPQAFRSLVVPSMTNPRVHIILPGLLLDLRQLRRLLSLISRGDRIWTCPRTVPEDANRIAIRYSNPIYGETLPNQIVYQFPLFRDKTSGFPAEERTYVCLSLDVAEVIQCGLYFEDGQVKEDCFEDLSVFFNPIRFELLSQLRIWNEQISAYEDRNGDAR